MQKLIRELGYNFKDPALLELALTHRSAGAKNNERLEFLGDSLVNFIITTQLFALFPKASEGQLTRMRAQLVCADMLTSIAKQFKLGDFIILGSGEKRSGGHQRASILADALEAIIGSIYLDSNCDMVVVQTTVLVWFKQQLQDFVDHHEEGHKDSKTVLQELLQSQHLGLPEYQVIKTEGEQHAQTFYVRCKIDLLPDAEEGVGNSRRKAEQMAAEKILVKLKHARK